MTAHGTTSSKRWTAHAREERLDLVGELLTVSNEPDVQQVLMGQIEALLPFEHSQVDLMLLFHEYGLEGQIVPYLEAHPSLPLLTAEQARPTNIVKTLTDLCDGVYYEGLEEGLFKEVLTYASRLPEFYLTTKSFMEIVDYLPTTEKLMQELDIRVKPPYSYDFLYEYGDYFNQERLGKMVAYCLEHSANRLTIDEMQDLVDLVPHYAPLQSTCRALEQEEKKSRIVATTLGLGAVLAADAWFTSMERKKREAQEPQPEVYTRYRSEYAPGDLDAAGFDSPDSFQQALR